VPLTHLLAAVPDWFKVTGITATEILGSTSLHFDNAVGIIEVDLRIHEDEGVIAVQEQEPGTRFPKTCHERHLQSDEHFCIGFNAGYGIVSFDHGVVWWGLLKHFLRLQRVAERTRRWPPQQEVAHGSAGPHQLAALDAARQLGVETEYMAMLAGEPAWFSDPDLQFDIAGTLGDGSLPCPVGCERHGALIPRSECCRPDAVAKLVTEEKLRREEVESYYAFARILGEECCGTMLTCGLRDPQRVTASAVSMNIVPNP
jgi:hypothetical protein